VERPPDCSIKRQRLQRSSTPPIGLGVFASGAWLPFAALLGGCWFIGAGLLWFLPSRVETASVS